MKTLYDIQNELAQEIGYVTMKEYIHELINSGSWYTTERLVKYINELSVRVQQEQQKLIADNADTKMERYNDLQDVIVVDKSSIINENNIIR